MQEYQSQAFIEPSLLEEHLSHYESSFAGISELQRESKYIICSLINYQTILGIQGSFLEIGVNRAATAALLASFLSPDELLFLIEAFQSEEQIRSTIEDFTPIKQEQIIFIKKDSTTLARKWGSPPKIDSPLKLIHIDGEHSYDAVLSDLALAHERLSSGGIIIIDDIFNFNSACCTEAMFTYLNHHRDLHIASMGFGKAFLCESRYLNSYRSWFISLPDHLGAKHGVHIRLCFNGWGYERSYITLSSCGPSEPKFQVVGARYYTLAEALHHRTYKFARENF